MLMMQLHGVAEVECLFLHAYITAGTIKAAAAPTDATITSTISSLLGGVEVVGGLFKGVSSPPDPPPHPPQPQPPGVHLSIPSFEN
jgi:hypothetical protein